MIWFLSDGHNLHHNCAVKYRGFESVEHQAEVIRDGWLSCVGKRDKVFILGDVGHNKDKKSIEFYRDLPGYKHLVMGNHDQCAAAYLKVFDKISGLLTYKGFWLSHAPIHPQELRGRPCIHGHIHQGRVRLASGQADPRYYNVNLDVNNYKPVNFEEIWHMDQMRRKYLSDGYFPPREENTLKR